MVEVGHVREKCLVRLNQASAELVFPGTGSGIGPAGGVSDVELMAIPRSACGTVTGSCPSSEYLRQKAAGFSGGRGSSDG